MACSACKNSVKTGTRRPDLISSRSRKLGASASPWPCTAANRSALSLLACSASAPPRKSRRSPPPLRRWPCWSCGPCDHLIMPSSAQSRLVVSPYQVASDHVCSHFRQARMWPRRRAPQLGRTEPEQANPDLRGVLRKLSSSYRHRHHLRHSACVLRTSTSKGRADAAACSPRAASERYQPRLHETSCGRRNPRTRL